MEGLTVSGGDFYQESCTIEYLPQRSLTHTACDHGSRTTSPSVAYHGQSRNVGLNLSSPALVTTSAPSENGGSPACSKFANPIIFGGSHRADALESNYKDGCLKDPIGLDFAFISGALLARLMVRPEWTGADIKAELKHSLDRWAVVAKLVSGSLIMEDTTSVSDLGLTSGCLLQAIVHQCDVIVEGAGADKVNGCYVKRDRELESCPVYTNDKGIFLFKHRMPAGPFFWYFGEDGDLMNSDGYCYCVQGNQPHPPDTGWGHQFCPLGRGTLPTVIRKSEPSMVL